MNASLSPRDRQIIEARAIATTRAEFEKLIGTGYKGAYYNLRRLNLPKFPSVVTPQHAPEVLQRVRSMFLSGDSMGFIATAMGLRRGQVVGIINRAGLFRKRLPQPKQALSVRAIKRSLRAIPKARRVDFTARDATVTPLRIEFGNLEKQHCRYPYGDGPFTFCGHEKASGLSYCAHHAAIAYTPYQARNREPRPR